MRKNILITYCFGLFLIASFSQGCKKKQTIIKGSLVDAVFDTPIAGEQITLYQSKQSALDASNPGQITKISSTSTDGSGSFSFDFDIKKPTKYSYYLEYSADYTGVENCGTFYLDKLTDQISIKLKSEVEKGQVQNVELRAYYKSCVKIILKNATPFNEQDSITVYLKAGAHENIIYTNRGKVDNKANSTGSTAIPSGNVIFKWEVIKNNITTSYTSSLFLNRFEKRDYTIVY